MTSVLATLDTMVIQCVEGNEALAAKRVEMRGGLDQGTNRTSGLIPQIDAETGRYEIPESDLPASFVGLSDMTTLETEALRYTVVVVLALPSIVAGLRLGDDDLEDVAQLLFSALMDHGPLNATSLSNLINNSATAANAVGGQYMVDQVSLGGTEAQPRIEAAISFQLPATAFVGSYHGTVEATIS